MVYVTVKMNPSYHQMTIEELLFGTYNGDGLLSRNETNTRTYQLNSIIGSKFLSGFNPAELISALVRFNDSVKDLYQVEDKNELYDKFFIPKKSGGLRQINAPKPELMDALRRLKTIFEEQFHALYHTSAFAYVRGRSTIDAVKRHQANRSRWFAKLDLHDFFGSTNMNFVLAMLGQIFPFNEVMRYEVGVKELTKALELAMLNGGLPQGTPISPLITNVMMIPIDFALSNAFRDFENQRFVYTRYADDFIISSEYDFDIRKVEGLVMNTLRDFNAPFQINETKTRYGSSSGRNWNLGVMLNKDNEITVGHKNHRRFQSMLYNFVQDMRKGVAWSLDDLQSLLGLHSYYSMVERSTIQGMVDHFNAKYGVDVIRMIKDAIREG